MKKTINVIVSTIVTIALVISVIGVCFAVKSFITPHKQASSVDAEESDASLPPKVIPPTEQSILAAVNTERAKVGVAPLKLHPNISRTAQMKADDMIARNYRGHLMPDTNQPLTEEMRQLQAAVCVSASENLTWDDNVTNTKQSMNSWLNSPSHKAAMLDPKYTYTGIGVGDGKVVVQHFCVAR